MPFRVRYIERKPSELFSIEKVFRWVARELSSKYEARFEQLPFSSRVINIVSNLIFFRRPKSDIFHVTGHVHFICFRLPRKRTVLTIHDLGFLHENKGIKRYLLKKLYLDLPVARAQFITTISTAVRDEIIHHSGCDAAKIRVIENPLSSDLRVTKRKDFNEGCPTILQIGTMSNKNLLNLAEALGGISSKLIVIGQLTAKQADALRHNKVDFINRWNLSDEGIREAYDEADLVTLCSTYEGFGLPIIEAQAMCTPVVTSNLSPMKEVAGEGAYLVDPFSPASIREGIRLVINDESVRNQLIAEGLRNVERYSAKKIALQYEKLYDEVLQTI